jgi:hypothetical protein
MRVCLNPISENRMAVGNLPGFAIARSSRQRRWVVRAYEKYGWLSRPRCAQNLPGVCAQLPLPFADPVRRQ